MSPCCYALVSSIIELADSVHKLEVSSTQKMEKSNYSVFSEKKKPRVFNRLFFLFKQGAS